MLRLISPICWRLVFMFLLASSQLSFALSLGGTFDTLTRQPTITPSCLIAASNSDNSMLSQPQAILNLEQQQTLDQVSQALGVDMETQMNLGFTAARAAYHFARTSRDDDYTLNFVYLFKYAGRLKFKPELSLYGNQALTPEANRLLQKSPLEFRTKCGDSFIQELDVGTNLALRFSVHFNSFVEKQAFEQALTDHPNLHNILANLQTSSNLVNTKVDASIIQVGGKPDLLYKLLMSGGGGFTREGYYTVNCGTNAVFNHQCFELIDLLTWYTTTLSSQLRTPADYYATNPTETSWDKIGIELTQIKVDPQIYQAMQQLTQAYNLDLQDYTFLKNYYALLTTAQASNSFNRAVFIQLGEIYQPLMELYQDPRSHLELCFVGFPGPECMDSAQKFLRQRAHLLDQPQLIEHVRYLQTNHYLANIKLDGNLSVTIPCMFFPTSNLRSSIFTVYCGKHQYYRGNPAADVIPITIRVVEDKQKLEITNFMLRLNLSNTQQSNYVEVKVVFPGPLLKSSTKDNTYDGLSYIHVNSETHIPWLQKDIFNLTLKRYEPIFEEQSK